MVEAGDDPQERGLAAARRAEQRGQPTGPHLEVDVLERDEVAEPAVHAPHDDAGRVARERVGAVRGGGRAAHALSSSGRSAAMTTISTTATVMSTNAAANACRCASAPNSWYESLT